ncbi:MAG: hypothetical protein OQJ77_05290 [Thiovulaceae bacterium]|nr:hypothetical protein [Sulfurimonadaceae bacterium]
MRLVFKKGIALLITLFFIMAITISIGVGFKHVNEAKATIKDENFLLQTNIIIDDVLTFLKNSQELKLIKEDDSGEAFDVFLAQSEFIPFEVEDIKVAISIKSARRKVNLNDLLELEVIDNQEEPKQLQVFKKFLSEYNVNLNYVDMLKDSVSKYDINYYPSTGILEAKPDIFREYISSYGHLNEINEHYKNTYYENSLVKIDFKDLFYVGRENNTSNSYCIDSYYITNTAKVMLEGVNVDEAENFVVDTNKSAFDYLYCSVNDDKRYVIDVELEIIQGQKTANISFEYDILNSRGYNFSYEI